LSHGCRMDIETGAHLHIPDQASGTLMREVAEFWLVLCERAVT